MRNYKTKYTQTALYILLLIAVFVVMGVTKRCNTAIPLPKLTQGNSQGDTLDMAIVYGPLSYYVYEDTLGGLNYDLINRMERDLGRPIRLWPVAELNDALDGLQNNKYDMLASLPADSEIKQRFLTTRSIFHDRLVLIQLTKSDGSKKINSALDFNKDTVFIEKGSSAALRLKNLSDEIDNEIPIKEVNLSEEYLCMKVAAGEFPLAVVNEQTAKRMKKQYPALSFDNPISFTQFQVWLLPMSDTLLLKQTNNWLDTVIQSDSYNTLLKRYNL